MSFVTGIAVFLAVLGIVVMVGAPIVERFLMYHPTGSRLDPAIIGIANIKELELATPDGETVIAWYVKAAPGQPTLLYYHGNSGTLADRADRFAAYTKRGRGILMMAYRGYSGSTGMPSERANVADAKLAYDTLISMGVPAEEIILYGESIGTGVAVQTAAEKRVAGLILDAPYTSILEVAQMIYPYLPSGLLMRDRYETLRYLDKVEAPILVIHGEQDTIIPVEMGHKIAQLAPSPTEIVTFHRAGHSDHGKYGSYDVVNDWIDRTIVPQFEMKQGGEDRAAG